MKQYIYISKVYNDLSVDYQADLFSIKKKYLYGSFDLDTMRVLKYKQ